MIGLVTGALVSAIWQGFLLAAVVGLGLRLLPKTPAAVRFAIWFAVFGVVTAIPVISLWPHVAGGAALADHRAWLTIDARWSLAIAAVWLAASLVRAVTLVVAVFRVRALWKRATPVEVGCAGGLHPTHRDETAMDGAPELLQAGRRAQLCVSDEVDRPTVIGFFAPKILIPGWLLGKLTEAELEQIVLHETGHLGRADDWMNLLQKVALVVFPLNPALAWVERRLCFERELAVDERVLRAMAGRAGAAKAYASCLANLAEHRLGRRGLALALGALGRESELGRRVGRILRRGESMRPTQAKLVLGGAMLVLLGASAGLERCPQVIGFSPVVTQAAETSPLQGAGMLPRGYSYRAVVFHPGAPVINHLQQKTNVAHESLLKAWMGTGVQSGSQSNEARTQDVAATRADYGVHATLLRADSAPVAATDPTAAKTRAVPLVATSERSTQPGDTVVRWVVVTAWQVADGSRMVMTTETTQVPARRAVQTPTGDMAQPSEEMRPSYAAVPVRDGWLVFQL